jgi:hypothetical protein
MLILNQCFVEEYLTEQVVEYSMECMQKNVTKRLHVVAPRAVVDGGILQTDASGEKSEILRGSLPLSAFFQGYRLALPSIQHTPTPACLCNL